MPEPVTLRVDFVSDVACPWCAIGLASLQQALAALDDEIAAEIHLQPFELNPQLAFEGEDADRELMRKYGIDRAQLEANRKAIRERAAPLGVTIDTGKGSRVWNTFNAHRLLHWAGLEDRERALVLKQALFGAYFTENRNVADPEVLADVAAQAGLDSGAVRRVLAGDQYAGEVRAQERYYQQAGIRSVPATIVNRSQLIPGGQPPEVFEQALRQIATTAPAA